MNDIDFTSLPQSRPLHPLPVRETVREALQALFGLAAPLARLALIPFLVSFAMTPILQGAGIGPGGFFLMLGFAVNLYLVVWYFTQVQRLVLLGPRPETLRVVPAWREPEVRILVRFLGLMLLMMLASIPASLLFGTLSGAFAGAEPVLGSWLLGPLLCSALALLAFVFVLPAASVGHGYGFGRAWSEGRGAFLSVLALVLIVVVPVDLAIGLLNLLLVQLQLATDLMIPRVAVGLAANYLSLALAGTVFSVAFAKRTGWTGPPASST